MAVTSRQNAGQTLAQVFPKFASHPKSKTLRFTEPKAELLAKQADVVFLALPHGVAAEYAVPLLEAGCAVIDLSADFRLKSAERYKEFYAHDHPAPELLKKAVYGLPEIYRDEIRKSLLIASPGCYPTSILLPVIPLLKAGLVKPTGIIADSLSGVSGAGRKAEADYLFCECNESVRPYGVPKHRHLSEIEEQLSLAAKTPVTIQFTPHLIPVNRGILTTLYLAPEKHFSTEAEMKALNEKISACYAKSLWPGTVRPVARRQGIARHEKRYRHERHRNRVAAGSAHGPAHRHERGGQPGQGRQRPGRAKPEYFERLAGNGGIGII